jgi:hypothetical protein
MKFSKTNWTMPSSAILALGNEGYIHFNFDSSFRLFVKKAYFCTFEFQLSFSQNFRCECHMALVVVEKPKKLI